jgi:DnaJ-class molecular chaperone
MPTIYGHLKPNYRLFHWARSRQDEIKKEIDQLNLETGLLDQVVADCKEKVCPTCMGEGVVMKPIPGCECDGPRQHTCDTCKGSGTPVASTEQAQT